MSTGYAKDTQFRKFCAYGFLKNQRFFESFIILYFLNQGITYLQIGFLYSMREILLNLLEVPAGFISDSLGRKKTMITSFAMYIVCFALFSAGSGFTLFAVAFIFYALGDAFRTGTHKAMIYDYLKINGWSEYKVDYYGQTRSWSQKGSAISSLIAGAVIFISGNYRWVFIISLIPAILDLLLIASYPKALDGKTSSFNKAALRESFGNSWRDFKTSFSQRKVLKAIANTSVYSGYYKALKDFLQPVMQALALSLPFLSTQSEEKRTAVIVGVLYFVIYMLTSRASKKSALFSGKFKTTALALNFSLFAGLSAGLISGLFMYFGMPFFAVLFYILIYLIENVRKPVGMAYTTDYVKHEILATALSAESQLKTIWAAVFIFLTGFLADKFSLGVAITAISISGLILFPLLRVHSERQSKKD
jgi:MFS family permease